MKTLLFTLFFALTATSVFAIENQRTVCTHGNQERVIEVVYTGDGDVPCEVQYTKDGNTQVLWSAQNLQGYCEEKAAAFLEKQRGWGWNCDTAIEFVIDEAAQ